MYGSYDSTIQHSLTGKTIDTIEKRKQYDPFDMDDPLVIAERRGELHLEIEEAEEELKQAQKERFNAAYGTEEWIYLDQYVTTIEADLKELKHEYDNLV
jgi:sugar-specific transcriptional regulator TrmB